MNSGFDPLNLILLAAAIIVFWRLRSVLGQRTGTEKPPFEFPRAPKAPPAEQLRKAPIEIDGKASEMKPETPVWAGYAEEGSALAHGLEAIAARSASFKFAEFLTGASLAYEMVLEAFARGDKQALKALLSKDVFDSFSSAIDARQKAGQSMLFQFVSMKDAKPVQGLLKGNRANIVVQFTSEMISATKDAEGKVIDGDGAEIQTVSDTWTFERDVTSRDPNWKLIATQENA